MPLSILNPEISFADNEEEVLHHVLPYKDFLLSLYAN
jgi:hypothetical protein